MASAFPLGSVTFEWECYASTKSTDGAAADFQEKVNPLLTDNRLTSLFWDHNRIVAERARQTGLFLISCPTGVDRSNVAGFCFALKIVGSILSRFGGVEVRAPEVTSFPSADPETLEFVRLAFRRSGDIMAFMFRGAPSACSQEIARLRGDDRRPLPRDRPIQPCEDLPGSLRAYQTQSPVLDAKCVSIFPGIQVIHPSRCWPWIFSTRRTISHLTLNEQPLIISLQRPVCVEELAFALPETDFLPSTVSVCGGVYVDRMFPIATDLALVKAGCLLRFPMNVGELHSADLRANRYQRVRYLQFTFQASTEFVALGNIYVYGTQGKPDKLAAGNASVQIVATPTFELAPGADRRAVLRDWEENRIKSGMTQADYQRHLARKGLHPRLWSIDAVAELRDREVRKDAICCV
jgi:hypothetical protein